MSRDDLIGYIERMLQQYDDRRLRMIYFFSLGLSRGVS